MPENDEPKNPHADGPEQLPEPAGYALNVPAPALADASAGDAEQTAAAPPRVDPWAETRVAITEESDIHKTWMEEARAVKTVEDFTAFHHKLMNTYSHDYGTICHAVAALSIAGACLANHDPVMGGITGFQAGAVMWEWLSGWGTGPKNIGRMLDFEQMLYPRYARRFNFIGRENWEFLQKRAAELIAKDDTYTEESKGDYGEPLKAAPAVRAHWESVARGEVPFGWSVPATEDEEG